MRRILLVGNGGRESAIASRLSRNSEVMAFMAHRNPSLLGLAVDFAIGNVCDAEAIVEFARRGGVDLAVVSADAPLAAGVVDALLAARIPTVGPDRLGAQIEWDKAVGRQIVDEVAVSANPRYALVHTNEQLSAALAMFGDEPIVVKPAGLTGGKGVKVMGPHLHSVDDARRYAEELLRTGPNPRAVLIEERISAIEFTIQAITDGISCVFPPATFDYPYRYDGDIGDGTGGMGCYTAGQEPLPFMAQSDYDTACDIIEAVLERWRSSGRRFSGVLNSGFFLTGDGLKVIEFNARFGDPEAMNIMALLMTDMTEIVEAITDQRLSEIDVKFASEASVVTYLVAPSYPQEGQPIEFHFDEDVVRDNDCDIHFASCERLEGEGDKFRTVGSSRVLALSATDVSIARAHARIQQSIERALRRSTGNLEWRVDVGSPSYIAQQCDQTPSHPVIPFEP